MDAARPPQKKARPLHSGCPPPSVSRLGFACQHPATGALSPRVTPRGARLVPSPPCSRIFMEPWAPAAALCWGRGPAPHHRPCPRGSLCLRGGRRRDWNSPGMEAALSLASGGAPSRAGPASLQHRPVQGSWAPLCSPQHPRKAWPRPWEEPRVLADVINGKILRSSRVSVLRRHGHGGEATWRGGGGAVLWPQAKGL